MQNLIPKLDLVLFASYNQAQVYIALIMCRHKNI